MRNMRATIVQAAITVSFLSGALTLVTRADAKAPSIASVIADMSRPGEAFPTGVPLTKAWARSARVNLGNRPGRFAAVVPWAQVMQGPGNHSPNADVEVDNFRLLIALKGEHTWREMSTPGCVAGGLFPVTYTNDSSTRLYTADLGGKCIVRAVAGQSAHFWPQKGRVPLPNGKIAGLVVLLHARLSPCDQRQRYLLSVGADYWLDMTARWDHFKTNGDAAIGRMKWLTCSYRWFSMTTVNADEANTLPPLVDASGWLKSH